MARFNAYDSGMRGSEKAPAPEAPPDDGKGKGEKKKPKYDAYSSGMRGNEKAPEPEAVATPDPKAAAEAAAQGQADENTGKEVHPGVHITKNKRIIINPARMK